ncbi:transglycosylase SLT domain-containing protein [Acidiphilium sp. C61]|uniref:lytic transglycosylase domain-containing protein n=1 Tax=Acidiphilium sp. C61 TaxID=1671485 RepID=UPI00191A95EB|nr:transglycosylase SLT domain-containing protein [Acidiphilium sp. C61]
MITPPALAACIRMAAATYHVPSAAITAEISAPKPPDAVGIMGIPPAWLPELAGRGFDPAEVSNSACVNVRAGAMILSMTPGHNAAISSAADSIPAPIRAIVLEAVRLYDVAPARVVAVLHSFHPAGSLGPMGIPRAWVPTLAANGFDLSRLESDPGYAAAAGVWILGVERLGRMQTYSLPAARFSPIPPAWLLDIAAPIARQHGLPLALVLAVAAQESGFRPGIESPVGAVGLMQLMPATATRFGVSNRRDATQSLEGGAAYLEHLKSVFAGNLPLMLAAYNAGSKAVIDHGNRIPPFRETQNYVPAVLARYRYYQRTLGGQEVVASATPATAKPAPRADHQSKVTTP